MYFSKPSSSAFAREPMAAKMVSGRKLSAKGPQEVEEEFHDAVGLWQNLLLKALDDVMTTEVSEVWISSSVSRSSTETTCCCIGIVFARRSITTSLRFATSWTLSLAALVTKALRTSYAAVRSWLSCVSQ